MKNLFVILFGVLLAISSAFAQDAGNRYGEGQVLRQGSTQIGTVVQVDIKEASASTTSRSVGASIGAAVGGLVVANTGKSNYRKNLLGALIGGLAGERIGNVVSRSRAQEIVIQIGSNEKPTFIVVVMPEPYTMLSEGQRVLITNLSGKIRVMPFYSSQFVQR